MLGYFWERDLIWGSVFLGKTECGMLKVLFRGLIAFCLLMFSTSSFSVIATLESCNYKYIRGWGNSVYVGIYKSSVSEDRFTRTFKSYCPNAVRIQIRENSSVKKKPRPQRDRSARNLGGVASDWLSFFVDLLLLCDPLFASSFLKPVEIWPEDRGEFLLFG